MSRDLAGLEVAEKKRPAICYAGVSLSNLLAILQLLYLVTKGAGCVFQVLLLDGGERAQHNQLQNEICEGAQDHEVVKASLHLAHFGGPPVGDPVDKPNEVAYEGNRDQQHQLELVVLHMFLRAC